MAELRYDEFRLRISKGECSPSEFFYGEAGTAISGARNLLSKLKEGCLLEVFDENDILLFSIETT